MNATKKGQDYLVQKIRTQYTQKQHTELDELRALNQKVTAPANAFGYLFGSLAALVMGFGMSLVMTDIGETVGIASPMEPGIGIGLVGIAMAIANYPIYKRVLENRRKKYAQKILSLSDRIMHDAQV